MLDSEVMLRHRILKVNLHCACVDGGKLIVLWIRLLSKGHS